MEDELDPIIHQSARLRVMALLQKNREAPTTWIQQQLSLTPGNLDAHVQRLAAAGYVEQGRRLTTSGFQSWVRITRDGDAAYERYRQALKRLLDTQGP